MLLNPLASSDQLASTPSRQDGVPENLENEIRIYGCQLIQQAGIMLKLPQRTMATAQVLFQRFWFVSSLKHFSSKDICMGSLFLSTKLEETPARLRDLINVFDYLIKRAIHSSQSFLGHGAYQKQTNSAAYKPTNGHSHEYCEFEFEPQSYFSQTFYDMKDALVVAEMQILKRLGFNVQVNLPYATMVNYAQLLGLAETQIQIQSHLTQPNENSDCVDRVDPKAGGKLGTRQIGFAQRAWGFLNDALQTPVYCMFPPHVLACAAIYLTAQTSLPPLALPLEPEPWWLLFDVTRTEIRTVSAHILRLYHPQGPVATLKEETGGLCHMLEKANVRGWLAANGGGNATPINTKP